MAWKVKASREVMGGIGSCGHAITSRGYSELSTNPSGPLDFAALGGLPCWTRLKIVNPANGRVAWADKQDIGAGSKFLPVMGLYPKTLQDLGLSGDEFTVVIERQDQRELSPVRGDRVANIIDSTPAPSKQVLYVNPLHDADVTPSRIDQGVDYGATGYFSALAECTVTMARNYDSGWGGAWIEYRITQPGPLEGDTFYAAEGFDLVVTEGQSLHAGDHIARFNSLGHVEVGQSAGDGEDISWARKFGGGWTQERDNDDWASRAGIAFSNLIAALGGKPGILRDKDHVYGDFPRWTSDGSIPLAITNNAGSAGLAGQVFSTPGTRLSPQAIQASANDTAGILSIGPYIANDWHLFNMGTRRAHASANAALDYCRRFQFKTTGH